ncbi:MAG: c-type cytochrome biogenesis protein CcmI [Rhodobacteraceae bacterium]|jgi:cytochrome c-type biogenesis protein CcmH|uniref:c-type cytochrome biogenesis protein CcmI n=1 Tax=Albidovulum sp. TaxID=1872424 RepID=UPI001DB664C3|nr:c-type cytochrome biogenesis protein CcmI [uncultured Defluviimonas sp.]MCB2124447.1 c-type cytochrome biogenesis protein CcmI [Paracoccaceae bacterium]MCC0070272.1 c-type cytochrome biogenesis protein CcmI [Paracoccaceae bacterium]
MLFWTLSIGLAALVALALARALWRGGAGRAEAEADLQVYRDQLREVDRDLARGVMPAAEADRARIEISRKLLEADRTGRGAVTAARGNPLIPLIVIGAAVAGAVGLYATTGAPGYPDLPIAKRIARAETFRETRPSQAEAEAAVVLPERPAPAADYLALVERLRAAVADKPDDVAGQRLLARNEAVLGNFPAAIAAQRRVIELSGTAATAEDFATLADTMILATGGYVSPEAEEALDRTLERDPRNGTARFYLGLMWAQTGRPDHAFALWRGLLEEGPEEAPWIPAIRADIAMLAQAAGVNYMPPPAPGTAPGPDAGQVAAAAEMTPEERQQMIRGMVDQLSDRLASEGGPAADWARLIMSLGVLGEAERAKSVFAEAEGRFAGRDADLAVIRAAAAQAGVAE